MTNDTSAATNTNDATINNPPITLKQSCYQARQNTIPPSLYGKLRPPFINLGFPKTGTTSLHSFFACAGYRSMHYRCGPSVACAECIRSSVEEGKGNKPLANCGKAEAYSQLDNGSHGNFPQVQYLEQIVESYPNATFLLTFRNVSNWYHSLTHWPPINTEGQLHMSDGLMIANILPEFPSGVGNNEEEFSAWFCTHVERVREVISRLNRTLVEIDIDNPNVAEYVTDVFDIHTSCWGHTNINKNLHPSGNESSKSMKEAAPWFVQGKYCIKGKTKYRMKRRGPLPVLPGVPPWMLIINDTCSNRTL
eukprot:CAMPEP_0183720338 /NCGR_PEP_ID=MMETSP0737-20130205/12976_1 /TAXON_ID=385413 /ORGANISM="Thalassiosira miniscula, Strain CCMP1093" /LENGTH=306 /DNA_ID=CAMNT_0025950185 /DNA_START=271 /DNA_END=1191 /DNA_ORIENTATION=+